jgi:YbbR domain-containing protein
MKPNSSFYVFIICLLFAGIIWFLNALNKNYTTQIEVPISYINLPQNTALLTDKFLSVKVDVESDGYTLLNSKFNTKHDSLYLNFDNASLRNQGKKRVYFFTEKNIKKLLEDKLGFKLIVKKIKPEVLEYYFEKLNQKNVPIKLSENIKTAKQLRIKKITLIPDQILLTGSENILNEISYIETDSLVLDNLSENKELKIGLKNYYGDKELYFNPQYINLKIEIEKYTEKSIVIPINIINLIDNTKILLLTEKVKVSLKVPFETYENIRTDKIKAYVTVSPQNNMKILEVNIEGLPKESDLISISPSTVEYLILNK